MAESRQGRPISIERVPLNHVERYLLGKLVATGLYGASRAEAIVRILDERLRLLVEPGAEG